MVVGASFGEGRCVGGAQGCDLVRVRLFVDVQQSGKVGIGNFGKLGDLRFMLRLGLIIREWIACALFLVHIIAFFSRLLLKLVSLRLNKSLIAKYLLSAVRYDLLRLLSCFLYLNVVFFNHEIFYFNCTLQYLLILLIRACVWS